jgi:hypothetical protein
MLPEQNKSCSFLFKPAIAVSNMAAKKIPMDITSGFSKVITCIRNCDLFLDRDSTLHLGVDHAGIIVRARTKEPLAGRLA